MKPLLEDFNPEASSVYDECLKEVAHDLYLHPARELKAAYGNNPPAFRTDTSDIEMRNLMIEHDVMMPMITGLNVQIPTEYEIFSGYLLQKTAARDYDLRERVSEQVLLVSAFN